MQTFTFNTEDINLTAGGQYLLVLHQLGYGNSGNLQIYDTNQSYGGGRYLIMDNFGSWYVFGNPHSMAFQAVFNAAPEPASLSLMALGVSALLIRRQRVAGA
jgi:hypothetical protein